MLNEAIWLSTEFPGRDDEEATASLARSLSRMAGRRVGERLADCLAGWLAGLAGCVRKTLLASSSSPAHSVKEVERVKIILLLSGSEQCERETSVGRRGSSTEGNLEFEVLHLYRGRSGDGKR